MSAAGAAPADTTQSEGLPGLLRQSLRGVLADERYEDSDEDELRVAVRAVCERARQDGVRAEHLLIVLKESWRDLPEQAEIPRFAADEALARVVSACINEYYGDERCMVRDAWVNPYG